MSDPRNGEPVDPSTPVEPTAPVERSTPVDGPTPTDDTRNVDDVVGRANEGLAEAEAASRDAVSRDELDEAHHDLSYIEAAGPEPVEEPVRTASATPPADADAQRTTVITSSEPAPAPAEEQVVAPAATAAPAAAPQPIFVQAPEAPRPRGNRGAAGAIGLLAALVFAVLYLAAALAFGAVDGDVTGANIVESLTAAVTSFWFWVPVLVFFLAFWLLGAIINRGRWGQWVILGLLVGVAAYGGHLLGQLFQAPFWTLTASQGAELVQDQLLAPLAIVAFILGREITVWFGAWVAARGARVTELNNEAQREYERTLEAGPQLHRL